MEIVDMTIEVIKGGLLQMPEGAEEALKGGEAEPAGEAPKSSRKRAPKKSPKKKDADKDIKPDTDA